MLKTVRNAAESHLGHNNDSALAKTPNLVTLNREDIEDTFEHIGLESPDNDNSFLLLFYKMNAGAASIGIGLCRTYADAYSCTKENQNMPLRYATFYSVY